ncbi:MAG: type II toxin-antitoxin system RelE/ParE family toxin [Candidatus Micrarchaeota archaeon]|nr:type II toxin-antitoxin system RelE/ParE family toxin [Candidatus Micrarchaeota archaeon]
MRIEVTREFEKDTKKITEKERQRLDEIVVRLAKSESLGKQLHHMKDVFSIYVGNKRLVYRAAQEQDKVVLLFFKSREGVYDYLK